MREAFENALRDNPDDLAGWCAFADWLAEQGDPRGEFMQTQIALEDASRSKDERRALQEREAELLAEHEAGWLGDLGPHLLARDETKPRVEHWWARGVLTEVRAEALTFAVAQALAAAPAARHLRALRIESALHPAFRGDAPPKAPLPPGETAHESHFELIGAPWLARLRSFQMGDARNDADDGLTETATFAPGLEHLVAVMARVEELQLLCDGYGLRALLALPNLSHLQVLRMVGIGPASLVAEGVVPLDELARNPALAGLTHLMIHPDCYHRRDHDTLPLPQARELFNGRHLSNLTHLQLRFSGVGDAGVDALIQSPLLRRLEWLDLRNGAVTDFGARALANCAAAKNLRRLDLSRNRLTQHGLNLLKRAGVNAVASNTVTRREQALLDDIQREADIE